MTVWVYAGRKQDAEQWAREQGLRPRDVQTFGTRSRWEGGMRFGITDRIVILGEISHLFETVIARNLSKSAGAPEPERLPLPC